MIMVVLVLMVLVVTAVPVRAGSTDSGLLASPRTALFGEQVSMSADGQTILVGAPDSSVIPKNGTSVFSAGEAFLYNSQGRLLHTFADTNPVMFEQYAYSVSISADGNLVLIGAPQGGASGMAFLYNRGGHLIQAYKPPSPAGANIGFGWSVAFLAQNDTSVTNGAAQTGNYAGSESVVLIGAIMAPGASLGGGAVGGAGQVYKYDAARNLLHVYADPDPTVDENFGLSIASAPAGNVAGGAPNAVTVSASGAVIDSAGKALLFDPTGNLRQTYRDPDPTFFEQFGWSISLSTKNLLPQFDVFIGAPHASSSFFTVFGGAVFLFGSTGTLFGKIPNRSTDCSEVGNSISISSNGTSLATAAPLCVSGTGTVFLFSTRSTLIPTLHDPSPRLAEKFGFSVSMSADGSLVVVGALFRGNAFVYDSSGNLLLTL